MSASDAIAWSSLLVAISALVVACYAISRANKTTSAATMVTLIEGFRSAWERFFSPNEGEKRTELAELLNLLEVACAIWLERSVSGNSAKLLDEYLNNVLRLLTANAYASEEVKLLLQDRTTFVFIRRYFKLKQARPSASIPLEWYQ